MVTVDPKSYFSAAWGYRYDMGEERQNRFLVADHRLSLKIAKSRTRG
jgi:hypothetical protein